MTQKLQWNANIPNLATYLFMSTLIHRKHVCLQTASLGFLSPSEKRSGLYSPESQFELILYQEPFKIQNAFRSNERAPSSQNFLYCPSQSIIQELFILNSLNKLIITQRSKRYHVLKECDYEAKRNQTNYSLP